MTRAIYPGTFDPITLGHVDIALRSARLFEEVVVGVYAEPPHALFPLEERLALVEQSLTGHPTIRVEPFDGLSVELARKVGATAIVRGLRAISDFEHEFQMALMSRKLAPELDVVSLMTAVEYTYLSSSIVKEVARLGGDVSEFVPPHVLAALRRRLGGDA